MGKFIGSNIAYILWFIIYFLFAWLIAMAIIDNAVSSFLITLLIYGLSVTIALSPIGEFLLVASHGCREPATEHERNYLMPLFEEVYEQAKNEIPQLNRNIKLYVMDGLYVNAFAIGRKTIAVTRGAIETFTPEELKGVLAHEFGHMRYGHTKALLLSFIGNAVFSVIMWIWNLILSIIETISGAFAHMNVVAFVIRVMAFAFRVTYSAMIFIFVYLGEIILSLNSRSNEFQADKFAFSIGYGRELTSGLYLLQKINMGTKLSLAEQMKATHPHLADRIDYLEKLEMEAYENVNA